MTFEDALKLARRNTYVHDKAWRVAVICTNAQTARTAMIEAKALIEASSLGIEAINHATMTIHLERGAILRFFVVQDSLDVYKLAGFQFTQIMFIAGREPYPASALEYLRALLRSPTVDSDKLLWQEYVTL